MSNRIHGYWDLWTFDRSMGVRLQQFSDIPRGMLEENPESPSWEMTVAGEAGMPLPSVSLSSEGLLVTGRGTARIGSGDSPPCGAITSIGLNPPSWLCTCKSNRAPLSSKARLYLSKLEEVYLSWGCPSPVGSLSEQAGRRKICKWESRTRSINTLYENYATISRADEIQPGVVLRYNMHYLYILSIVYQF